MTQSPAGGQPPPGWYLNPDDHTRKRWWDGAQWGPDAPVVTTQTALAPDQQANYGAAVGTPPPRGGSGARARWALGLGIAALVFAWVPVLGIALAVVALLLAILELASGGRGPGIVWATVLGGLALLIGIITAAAIASVGNGLAETTSDAVVESAPGAVDEPRAEPTDGEEQAAEAEVKEPSSAGIGDPVRDGKFEFTVTKVETGVAEVGDEYLGKKAQGQFVLVHLTVENIGGESQIFFGDNVTASDAKEREFSADSEAAIYLDDSNSFINEINPGNSAAGIVVFDVPKDTVLSALELHDAAFSGGVTVEIG